MTQQEALAILKTGVNVFLTGEPGAGKTHVVNEYVRYLRERGVDPAITASTGIAATHIGGMTIHSWSGIGVRRYMDKRELQEVAGKQLVSRRIKKASVLVIDEVSMLSPEMLDALDAICRIARKSADPFGGIQVVVVGDFFQLPPVVRSEERRAGPSLLSDSPAVFAYGASAWVRSDPTVCYLTEQHRQDDETFLLLLSAIRRNTFGSAHLEHVRKRKIERHMVPRDATKLFSHNADVDRVNDMMLKKLPGAERRFTMTGNGNKTLVTSLKKGCLSPEELLLKNGAVVMFTRNNMGEGYVNGTLGVVECFGEHSGQPVVRLKNGKKIEVEPADWAYEENGAVRAKITQVPLRLAWAITVHKSQGMSLDEAVMDLSGVFEFGQGYVALSRVRRLSGLHILGWNEKTFKVHPEILAIDERFRELSEMAVGALQKVSAEELLKEQKAFVLRCGGKNPKEGKGVGPEKKPERERGKARTMEEIRKKHPNAYMPWTEDEDVRLGKLFLQKRSVAELVRTFGRQRGAITARLVKLGLLEEKKGYVKKVWYR